MDGSYDGNSDFDLQLKEFEEIRRSITDDNMLSSEYYTGFLDVVQVHTETSDIHKTALYEIKSHGGATIVMNTSMNVTDTAAFQPELFYRHSASMTVVYCIAYLLVFAVGLSNYTLDKETSAKCDKLHNIGGQFQLPGSLDESSRSRTVSVNNAVVSRDV
ncbi:hypothetical protein ABEB36_012494 [Hypothenemus hampei]|uniref:Uncharacterized protein n=1 Tax=Hypothenemus hampei TaxID=57062 RepID=A0ABD1EBJ8_HYPHA